MSGKNRSKKNRSGVRRMINGVTQQVIVSTLYNISPINSRWEITRNVWMTEGRMGMYGIDATNMVTVISSHVNGSISS